MKKGIIVFLLSLIAILYCACTDVEKNSSFSITFIDVGQGDAALVECDGQYMLVDGGDKQYGDRLYQVLKEHIGVGRKLDILAISHLHADHIGGLEEALKCVSSVGITISNADSANTEVFMDVQSALANVNTRISIPPKGKVYSLGSAEVKVVDVASAQDNDSLILMVTYGDTRFLFTGDIEYQGQKRISDYYLNENTKIDLIKMPHHGAYGVSYEGENLTRLIDTITPDYAIISVGKGNLYNHPDQKTLHLLEDKRRNIKVYRTDENGDITVKSDGKTLSFQTSK